MEPHADQSGREMELHAEQTREAPVELSAAEQLYLRRFVRRHALSGAAGKALVASVAVALALALWPAAAPEEPARLQPAPAAPAAGAEDFAAELAAIRAEVESRSERAAPDPATRAAVDALAQRIEAIAREIDALRARDIDAVRARAHAAPPAPAVRTAAPDDAGSAGIAERLYNLELRLSQAESDRGRIVEQLLARVHDLEARQEGREREDASALRLLLDRVQEIERSRDVAEANRLSGQEAISARLAALETRLVTLPAAPQP